MSLQEAEEQALTAVDTMAMTTDQTAKFCGVWATVRPGLDILADLIPIPGPIIKSLIKVGDAVAKNNNCPS
ncbi:MAG: hypothetical protein EOO60_07685 [Hymenobacter sp.]|nr:MAG: hypothetical protein EOO60_07685 [Hymenobacter sp.]